MEIDKEKFNRMEKNDKRYILDSYFGIKENLLNQKSQLILTLISVLAGLLIIATFSREVFYLNNLTLLRLIISIILIIIPILLLLSNNDIDKATEYIDIEISKCIDIKVDVGFFGRIKRMIPVLMIYTVIVIIAIFLLMIWGIL